MIYGKVVSTHLAYIALPHQSILRGMVQEEYRLQLVIARKDSSVRFEEVLGIKLLKHQK